MFSIPVSLHFCSRVERVCFSTFQVSFLLGVLPVIVAYIYAEYLEYKKTSVSTKTSVRFSI